MPREYRHISQYAREIYKLREEGLGEYIHFHNNQRIQLKTKLTPQEMRSQYVA